MAKTYPTSSYFLHRYRIGFIFLLCIGVGALGALFYVTRIYTPCSRISCLLLPKTAVLKLTEVYEEVRGSVFRARYQTGDTIVRVDVRTDVDPEASVDYIQGRIAGMKALYDNIRSPYPGLLSNEIICDEGFKPTYKSYKTSQNIMIQEVVGYLNNRLTFGSCQKDQAVYRGAMVLFACPQKRQLYQVEFISPVESFSAKIFQDIVDGMSCR